MNKKEAIFFQKLSDKCGYISEEMAERFYYALLKLLLEELKKNRKFYLPKWGEFIIKDYPAARRHQVWTKEIIELPSYKRLVFHPYHKLKKYIKK